MGCLDKPMAFPLALGSGQGERGPAGTASEGVRRGKTTQREDGGRGTLVMPRGGQLSPAARWKTGTFLANSGLAGAFCEAPDCTALRC